MLLCGFGEMFQVRKLGFSVEKFVVPVLLWLSP